MSRRRVVCALGILLVSLGAHVNAAPIISVGSHTLQPNQAGQTIVLDVTGGDSVAGLVLNVQIADGGSANGDGRPDNGPLITSVDLLQNGAIFGANNNGVDDLGSYPQLAIRSVITSNGTISAAGRLLTLSISTVGVAPNTYSLSLFDTLNSYSTFLAANGSEIPTMIVDGSITVLPEPAMLGVSAVLAFGLSRRRRFNR